MNEIAVAPDVNSVSLRVDDDGVAWLTLDGPGKLNILSSSVLARFNDLLGEAEQGIAAGRIKAVIIRSGKDGSFIAETLVKNGFRVKLLKEEEIDLEDVFMGITKGITN